MNKIFLILFLLPWMLFSSNLEQDNSSAAIEQKEIRTYQDFLEFEKTLKNNIIFDAKKINYYLGLLYSKKFIFKNGKIQNANLNKAEIYFKKSLDEGNTLSAYNIAMISVKNNNIDQAIFVLQMTLGQLIGEDENSVGAYLSACLASIVLDFKSNDPEALSLAKEHLSKYVKKAKMPTGYYLLSQIYLRLGEYDEANYALNTACTEVSRVEKIDRICKSLKVVR